MYKRQLDGDGRRLLIGDSHRGLQTWQETEHGWNKVAGETATDVDAMRAVALGVGRMLGVSKAGLQLRPAAIGGDADATLAAAQPASATRLPATYGAMPAGKFQMQAGSASGPAVDELCVAIDEVAGEALSLGACGGSEQTRVEVAIEALSASEARAFHEVRVVAPTAAQEALAPLTRELDRVAVSSCQGGDELSVRISIDGAPSLERRICRDSAEQASEVLIHFLARLGLEGAAVPAIGTTGSGLRCLNPCCWFPGGNCKVDPCPPYACGGGARG